MARTPDNRPPGQGFEGPFDERSKRVDIIASAENVIIPAARRLLSLSNVRFGPFGSSEDKTRLDALFAAVRDDLKKPIWGDNMRGVSNLEGVRQNTLPAPVAGVESRGEAVLSSTKMQVIEGSFIFGDYSVLSGAQDPKIIEALIVGGEVLSGDDDAATFTTEHLRLLVEIAEGVKEGDLEKVKSIIKSFEISGYLERLHSQHDKQNGPYSKFGEYATVAQAIDKGYLPALQEGESVNASVENSILYGRHAVLRNTLGGRISNSIILGNRIMPDAHLHIDNCWLIGEDGELYIPSGGRQGSPNLAQEAVTTVKDLPPSPLLTM